MHTQTNTGQAKHCCDIIVRVARKLASERAQVTLPEILIAWQSVMWRSFVIDTNKTTTTTTK